MKSKEKDTSIFSFSTVKCILVSPFFPISFFVVSLSASRFNHSFRFTQIFFWWLQRVFFVWCTAPIKMCILSCSATIDLKKHKKLLVIIKINDNLLFITKFYKGIYRPPLVKTDFKETHDNLFLWCWLNIKWL